MITLLLSFFVLYFTVNPKKDSAKKMRESLSIRLSNDLRESGSGSAGSTARAPSNVSPSAQKVEAPKVEAPKVGAEVYEVGQKLIVDFPETSFFEIGAIAPTRPGVRKLEKFAGVFAPYSGKNQLVIQAFTDVRKVRSGSPRYKDNLELSALRAVAAMRILQKAGVPLSAMKIGGYGEMAETQENLNRLQNDRDPLRFTRRIVLTIEPKIEGA